MYEKRQSALDPAEDFFLADKVVVSTIKITKWMTSIEGVKNLLLSTACLVFEIDHT